MNCCFEFMIAMWGCPRVKIEVCGFRWLFGGRGCSGVTNFEGARVFCCSFLLGVCFREVRFVLIFRLCG